MRRDVATPFGTLAVHTFGAGPPLVALHGFTYTGRQFELLASLAGHRIHAPDLPGHGGSRPDEVTLDGTLAALASLLDDLGPVPLLGYSQGGRLALLLALEAPEYVSALVVVSGSPGVADRAARVEDDEALAVRIETDGIDAFLDGWLEGPVTSTAHLPDAARAADRAVREDNDAAGLAAALRGYGQGAQPYVRDRLGELGMPALFLAGAEDETYATLARDMAGLAGDGAVIEVPGVGHNLILEAPGEVAAAIRIVTAG